MKRPCMPLRHVYTKEKSTSVNENQRLSYRWKDEQRKQIIKVTADHIAYIAEQIEHAKDEKEVSRIFPNTNAFNWILSGLEMYGSIRLGSGCVTKKSPM